MKNKQNQQPEVKEPKGGKTQGTHTDAETHRFTHKEIPQKHKTIIIHSQKTCNIETGQQPLHSIMRQRTSTNTIELVLHWASTVGKCLIVYQWLWEVSKNTFFFLWKAVCSASSWADISIWLFGP